MDCPRCKLTMEDAVYEQQPVKFCGNCWGYWMTRDRLDKIVDGVTYAFSKKEQKTISRTMRTQGDVDRGGESAYIQCPECDQFMERKKFHYKCPVEIDECAQHGIWLDTGEIKELQVFIERFIGE